MRLLVGVADMRVATDPDAVLVTHALGSCLGIAVHDPLTLVGGLLHVMLPLSRIDADKARLNPLMFVDTAVPILLRAAFAAGATGARLRVKVAGGAAINEGLGPGMTIGARNWIVLKRVLWKNGILIAAEEIGGTLPRTMTLEIGSGRVTLATAGRVRPL